MRLAMAQMSMVNNFERNYNKSLQFLDLADTHKADLIFFPKLQLTSYFPQYRKKDVGGALDRIPAEFAIELSDFRIREMSKKCKKYGIFASPNIYIRDREWFYDISIWIEPDGAMASEARQVCIADALHFHEKDYFASSKKGFSVYETPFGRVGIVIGYDRHLTESIAACVSKGADLVLVPVSNAVGEPLEMYAIEMRAAAFQNGVFVAMANRVGNEDGMLFAGESMVVDPNGRIVVKADDSQQFIVCNIELSEARKAREKRPYRQAVRPEL